MGRREKREEREEREKNLSDVFGNRGIVTVVDIFAVIDHQSGP
jgi:hypothetical protein